MAVLIDAGNRTELESRDGGPLPMQFFSTWEVRKVPANCMSRLCTLNITRLEILKPLEDELQSVVLAISMKVIKATKDSLFNDSLLNIILRRRTDH